LARVFGVCRARRRVERARRLVGPGGRVPALAKLIPPYPERSSASPSETASCLPAGRDGSTAPATRALLGVLVVTLLMVTLLTAIPSRIGSRRTLAEIFRTETA